jgi:hypothetical protein
MAQTMRFSFAELGIIKSVFSESEDDAIFKIVRKIMLQLPMNALELATVQTVFKKNPETMKVIRKIFIPEIDGDAPIHQVVDIWNSLMPRIEDLPMEKMEVNIVAKEKEIEYLRQQIDFMENEGNQPVKLTDMIESGRKNRDLEEIVSGIIAHNFIINYVEQRLAEIKILAGKKTETPEETVARLQQNSNK